MLALALGELCKISFRGENNDSIVPPDKIVPFYQIGELVNETWYRTIHMEYVVRGTYSENKITDKVFMYLGPGKVDESFDGHIFLSGGRKYFISNAWFLKLLDIDLIK